jgi:uncharacterized SAM-binding protein YcdF (DUF218 family)
MSPTVYVAYKIAKLGVYPLTWILALLLFALFASWRGQLRWLRFCVVSAFLLAYGLSLPPVARVLTMSIERRYAPPAVHERVGTEGGYDAVVVLAGGVQRQGGLRREDRLDPASLDRVVCGRALMVARLAPVVVFSGGNADSVADLTPAADIMARAYGALGPAPGDVRTEPRSRTTYENAVETSRLIGSGKRIALVTSALHMPRAMALFAQQGLRATAFPCEYLSGPRETGYREYVPDVTYFSQSTGAISEWVGLWLYTLAGKAAKL